MQHERGRGGAAGSWQPLEVGKVSRQGYAAVHMRINKTVWTPTKGQKEGEKVKESEGR